MKFVPILVLYGISILSGTLFAEELPKISLLPRDMAQMRGQCKFNELVWKEEGGHYLRKVAPVCRFVERPRDISKVHELAKSYGLKSVWDDTIEHQYGKREDGVVVYRGSGPTGRKIGIIANPKTRQVWAKFSDLMEFERDENKDPIVTPLISKEQAIEVCREWMQKFGIDESELFQGHKGFDVIATKEIIRKGVPERIYPLGYRLHFSQQIGGLLVQWHGIGGNLVFEIDDDGTLSRINGRLSAWEKIADYPILSKEEIIQAIHEQFYWRDDRPFVCDKVEVINVELLAYHCRDFESQPDFPLLYWVDIRLVGGEQDGELTDFRIPALKQQRHSYGPFVPNPKLTEPYTEIKPVVPLVEE